jgi:hypothetical protein
MALLLFGLLGRKCAAPYYYLIAALVRKAAYNPASKRIYCWAYRRCNCDSKELNCHKPEE